MTDEQPFSSREVRWFFEGSLQADDALSHWFRASEPFQKRGDLAEPEPQPRRDDQPDVYLPLPGRNDMGIKWREGLLQIKGRVEIVGSTTFCGQHLGVVERWIKWSYADVPELCRALFEPRHDPRTASVSKTRSIRLVDLQNGVAGAEEVDIGTWLDCGISAEITQLKLDGTDFYSLGFEAFPDTAITQEVFDNAVAAFLDTLNAPLLQVEQSMSYPAWLESLSV